MNGRGKERTAVVEASVFSTCPIESVQGEGKAVLEQKCLGFLSSKDLSIDGFNTFGENLIRLLGGYKDERSAIAEFCGSEGQQVAVSRVDSVEFRPGLQGAGVYTRIGVIYPQREI